MSRYLTTVLTMMISATLISCGQPQVASSSLDAYYGEDDLLLTYYAQRLYVISKVEIDSVTIKVNRYNMKVNVGTREKSDLPSFVTRPLLLNEGDIIETSARMIETGETKSLTFSAKRAGEDWAFEKTTERSPEKVDVPGNQVDAQTFLAAFNQYRSRYGLPAVQLSYRLTAAAEDNNNHQLRRGIGHWRVPPGVAQNSAMGHRDVNDVLNGWHQSKGHRDNMQTRRWTCMGIHRKGAYWTQNFSAQSTCN